jgi:hypothetical protein
MRVALNVVHTNMSLTLMNNNMFANCYYGVYPDKSFITICLATATLKPTVQEYYEKLSCVIFLLSIVLLCRLHLAVVIYIYVTSIKLLYITY